MFWFVSGGLLCEKINEIIRFELIRFVWEWLFYNDKSMIVDGVIRFGYINIELGVFFFDLFFKW